MGKYSWLKGLALALLSIVGGYAIFQIMLYLMDKLMESIGIIEPIWQYVGILIFVIIALIVGWRTGLKGAFKKLVK